MFKYINLEKLVKAMSPLGLLLVCQWIFNPFHRLEFPEGLKRFTLASEIILFTNAFTLEFEAFTQTLNNALTLAFCNLANDVPTVLLM